MVDETNPQEDPTRGMPQSGPQHPLPLRHPPLDRRQLLLQVSVGVVILVSGVGIGAGSTILLLQDRIVWQPPPRPTDRRGERGPRPPDFVTELRTKYSLSDEQVQKVRDLFAARFEAGRARWEQLRKIEADEREQLVTNMKGILTPEQFEPWHAEYQQRMAEMQNRPFWGPRGDHRGPPRGDRGPGGRRGPDGHRGGGPPRQSTGPNEHQKGGYSADRPVEPDIRPSDLNALK